METGSFTYEQLAKKNDNFLAPGFEILVDGKELSQAKYRIPGIEVEISSGGAVGGCYFRVEGQYDYEKSKWINDASNIIKIGTKLQVKGGYQKRIEIFYGFVDDFELNFDEEGAPFMAVSGLDGLGYLMNRREPFHAGEKKPKQIVQSVLQKSQSAGYAKKVTVGALEGFETPIVKEQMNDWEFLCMMAERYGATMLSVAGELIFDNLMTKTSPIMTLTVGKSVLRFTKRLSLVNQIGALIIRGVDIEAKAISAKVDKVTVGGEGKIASEWMKSLKDAVTEESNEFVKTKEECQKLAQNRFNAICMGFVSGAGECIGIPELIPGRYIKIDGADGFTSGTYFITKVIHRFNAQRYTTIFEVKGAKA